MRTERPEVVDGYRYWLEASRPAQNTIRTYISNATRWVNWCNDHEVDYRTATRDDVTYHLGEMRNDGRQPTTVQLRLLSLRLLYDYLVEEGKAAQNPARQVDGRKPQARVTASFSDDELRRMYAACQDHRERAIYLLLIGSGLRRNEIYGIGKGDIDWEQGIVTVLGKGAQYRMVAPGPMAIAALSIALEFEERLCPFSRDDYVWRVVKALASRARVRGRVHPHRFRHTFSTKFLDAGGTPEQLQMILGHAQISQSLMYARAGAARRALIAQRQINLTERLLLADAAG